MHTHDSTMVQVCGVPQLLKSTIIPMPNPNSKAVVLNNGRTILVLWLTLKTCYLLNRSNSRSIAISKLCWLDSEIILLWSWVKILVLDSNWRNTGFLARNNSKTYLEHYLLLEFNRPQALHVEYISLFPYLAREHW